MTIAMVFSPVAGAAGAAVAAGSATADAGAATNTTASGSDANLGVSVRAELANSDDGDRIPVIVVLESQPDNRFGDNMSIERMRSFAQDQQAGVRDAVAAAAERGAANDVRSFWVRNAIAVNATPSVVRDLAARSDVKRVVYDQPVHSLGSGPTGPLGGLLDELAEEGTLANSPSTQGFERATSGDRAWGVEYIGADAVQDRGVDGSGVNVSVVDTGIDDEHPALRGRVIEWQDFVANHTEPVDPAGHGTHVAGTIAGQPGREHAVGVAPDTNLFGARALDANGAGRTSDIMAAFEWSANQSADVISASLGVTPEAVETTGESELNSSETLSRNVSVPANISATGYQPASVFVQIAPADDVVNRSAAMANLSVSFSGPNGETLQRNRADWLYQTGVIPNTTGLWKYKPAAGPIPGGNWSLTIENAGDRVAVEYDAVAVYPSNGSDELSAFVNDLANTTSVTPVVSAGNTGFELGNRSIGSPGAAASAITVGASAEGRTDVASFSSRGPVGFDDAKRPGIDVIAPGMNVLSTIPTNQTGDDVPAYGTKSGTSMAAPHVAGVAALVLDAANGTLNRTQLTDRLKSTAQPAPGAPNVAGAGVVDAWAAVNQTTPLGTEVTDPVNRTELYGGLAGTYDDYGNVPIPAVEDDDDAPTGAPDLWAVDHNVGEQLAVRTHDATPNATFTLYVDTDRDDTTGDTARRGADEKLVVERQQVNGELTTDTTTYTYNAANGTYEADGRYADADLVREDFLRVGTYDLFPASFEWHLVAENANGSDALPAQGEGQRAVPTIVNRSIPVQAVSWDTGAAAPNTETDLTFTLTGPPGVVDKQVIETDANGSATTTLTLPYNTTKFWRFENFNVEITDEAGNAVSETVEAYPKEPAIHYGDPIYEDSGLDVFDRDYRAERNETLTVNVPIHYETADGIVPYNGTANLTVDGNGEGVTYTNIPVERGILTQTVDLSALDSSTSYASIYVEPRNESNDEWAGNIDIGTDADAALSPEARTVAPGGEANLSVRLTALENGAQRPLDGTAGYDVTWLTALQVHSLGTNLSGELGADLRRAATSGATLDLDAGERTRVQQAIEKSSIAPRETSGTVETGAHGVANFSVTAPDDAVFGTVSARAANQSSGSGNALIFVEDRVTGYIGGPTAPVDYGGGSLYVDGHWTNATQPSSHYDIEVDYYVDDPDENQNVTVSLYATTGAQRTVTLNSEGYATLNLSAPTVDSDDPAGWTEQSVLGIVHNRTGADGRAISSINSWLDPPFTAPETPPGRVSAEPTVTFANDTLNVDLSYQDETGALVSPTWTLLRAVSPSTYGTQTDLNVSYVNPSTSTPTYEISAPVDPAVPREFEVGTWTGIPPNWYFGTGAYEYVDGTEIRSSMPGEVVAGGSTEVSLTAVDRNGDPVPNATVVWEYRTYPQQEEDGEMFSSLPRPSDGGYRVGTTDADGNVAFEVAIDEDLGGQSLSTRAHAVTDNATVTGGYDYTYVTQADAAELMSDVHAPDSVAPGENVSVSATFENTGTLNATNATFTLGFYNESSRAIDEINSVNRTLAPGESFTLNGTITENRSAGYEVRAVADLTNVVDEFDEDNNVDTAFVDVVEPAPDLVAGLDAPDSVDQGENVSVNATFANAGTENATGAGFVLQFYNISSDSWETFAEVSDALDVGESLTLNGTVTHNQSGYEIRAFADLGDNVPDESNEENNIASRTVEVVGPAPDMATTLDAPDSVPAGEDITATATFENIGDATAENVLVGIGLRGDDGPLKTLNRTFEPGESTSLSVTVNRDVREYPFVAAAGLNNTTSNDPNFENNVAFHNVTVTGLSNDTVEFGFEPANVTADAGETLTMNVTADTGNASLYGATTVVNYDTDLLNVTAIEAGGFLASDGANTNVVVNETYDANGTAEVSVTRLNDTEAGASGISGTGTLATLTVEVAADAPGGASAALSIGQRTELSDMNLSRIPYVGNETTITVSTADVSVDATMNDTVLNVGSAAPVAVTASADAPLDRVDVIGPFGEQNGASPESDSFDDTLTINSTVSTWNGESYNEVNVTAEASVGETVARENVSVTVHIAGDATGEGTVNIFDAVAVGTAWDTTAGDERYGNGAPDLNSDGEVGVADAALLGQNWKDTAEVRLR